VWDIDDSNRGHGVISCNLLWPFPSLFALFFTHLKRLNTSSDDHCTFQNPLQMLWFTVTIVKCTTQSHGISTAHALGTCLAKPSRFQLHSLTLSATFTFIFTAEIY
jgi:hypothetical protein